MTSPMNLRYEHIALKWIGINQKTSYCNHVSSINGTLVFDDRHKSMEH